MGPKLRPAQQLAARFVQANPLDQFCVVQFNDEPGVTTTLTTNSAKIQGDLTSIHPRGGSALWDGVYLALNEVSQGNSPRKALLVISDGADNSSHYTEAEIANAVREAAIPLYAVGVFEPAHSGACPSDDLNGSTRLRRAAEQSGGHYFAIESVDDIPVVVAKITAELRAPAAR